MLKKKPNAQRTEKSKKSNKRVKKTTTGDNSDDDESYKERVGAQKAPPKSTLMLWVCYLIGEQKNPSMGAMETWKSLEKKSIRNIREKIARDLSLSERPECQWVVYLEYLLTLMKDDGVNKRVRKLEKDKNDDAEGRVEDRMEEEQIEFPFDVYPLFTFASKEIQFSQRFGHFNELRQFTDSVCKLYNPKSCFTGVLNRWDELNSKYKIGLDRYSVRTVYLRLLQLETLFRYEKSGYGSLDLTTTNFKSKLVFNYEYNCLYEYYGFEFSTYDDGKEFAKLFVFKHDLPSLSSGGVSKYLDELKEIEYICKNRTTLQLSSYRTREFLNETMADSERNMLELFAMEGEREWDDRMSGLLERDKHIIAGSTSKF